LHFPTVKKATIQLLLLLHLKLKLKNQLMHLKRLKARVKHQQLVKTQKKKAKTDKVLKQVLESSDTCFSFSLNLTKGLIQSQNTRSNIYPSLFATR